MQEKDITRIPFYMDAKTPQELMHLMMETSRKRDKSFDWSTPKPIYHEGKIVKWYVWRPDSGRDLLNIQDEFQRSKEDQKEIKKEIKKKSI